MLEESELNIDTLFPSGRSVAYDRIAACSHPWEILPQIDHFIRTFTGSGDYTQIKENIWIGRNCQIEDISVIEGPAIIGHGSIVKRNAVIRENVIAGENCFIGHFTELKNCILFDRVNVAHFNYVGDSILGLGAHLGAGAKLSNFKSIPCPVKVHFADKTVDTGLLKFGALLGDRVEVGCNAVTNPGTIVGCNTVIYPLVSLRGVVASNAIVKANKIIKRETER